jgi:guanosine-3',5'-bis(diphosphate) 3'-pyrophosphohydrolase
MSTETRPLSGFIAAVAFAAEKHRTQRRKDAEASPYINHPIALANVLANEGDVQDLNVLCAAVLHDTIEDTETTAEELASLFGAMVTSIVVEVTDDKSLAKEVRKQRQVEHASLISHDAKLVKIADKICNLRDILASPPADWSAERKQRYFDWAAQVVGGLRGVHPGLEAVFDGLIRQREILGCATRYARKLDIQATTMTG